MNTATQFFVQQKMQEAATRARAAMARVRQARTLREVRDLGNVTVDPLIRSIDHTLPELRQLRRACEQRAEQLVEEHLKELRQLLDGKGLDAFRARAGERHRSDWIFLRGGHSNLYRRLDRDLATLEHQWRRMNPREPQPPAEPPAA